MNRKEIRMRHMECIANERQAATRYAIVASFASFLFGNVFALVMFFPI